MPRFSGIIPPVITPLLKIDQLDLQAVDRIVNHLIAGGVNGLFVLGTTGEGPSLNYQIRYEMIERVCEAAGYRVPVLAGVTDTSFAEASDLARHAASSGAAAIVAAAPYYFATDQTGVEQWFSRLADASPIPLMLYNMPGCVDISLELETVIRLSQHPNIVGIKDSGGDLTYFRQLCEQFRRQNFVIFMGPEELIPQAVEAGADGGVCGGGNLLPSVYVDLFRAANNGNHARVAELRAVIDRMFAQVYKDPSGKMNLIPALKYSMAATGLCSALIAPPLQEPSEEHCRQITAHLNEILQLANSPLNRVAV